MNIILAEEKISGEQLPEQYFSKPSIIFGRDANECDVVFEKEKYPMVSRRHAELRWNDGRWVIADLESSYGTFLDGVRLSAPQAVTVDGLIQLGVDGPQMRVIWFEVADNSSFDISPAAPQSVPAEAAIPAAASGSEAPPHSVSGQTPIQQAKPPARARIEFSDGRAPFDITGKSVWLGREPDCDMVFDAAAGTVSRRHAEIRVERGEYLIADNNSFNGTLVNGHRIAVATALSHNDEIQLGMGGPLLKFSAPMTLRAAIGASEKTGHAEVPGKLPERAKLGSETMVFSVTGDRKGGGEDAAGLAPQLVMSAEFNGKSTLSIGRDSENDIRLDGLQISKRHARIQKTAAGIMVEDLGSTNGVFVNGGRVNRRVITPADSVQIGSFLLKIDTVERVGVFDTRSKTRVDAVNIAVDVKNRLGGGTIRLLEGVSLSFQPNEFIGILGPSGAGKSTLIDALNGVKPPSQGSVFVNNLNLYRHRDSLRQAIGYVPQEDVIHRELSVYRTLYYIARLRLSRDVSKREIDQIISEVMDVSGLAEHRNISVGKLSGGQRKRVSIAVELITKPSVIYLDEPTSGLDPATEDRVMKLFRQIAETGRTVIMTTHAMENVRLFDKIVVLLRGKLVFYGPPEDALAYLGATNFKQLFDKLQEPIEAGVREQGEPNRKRLAETVAEEWRKRFIETPQYDELIKKPLGEMGVGGDGRGRKVKNRLGIFGAIRQWLTLSRRYSEVLLKDRLNLLILFAQAPIIALLIFLVMGANSPRDFVYFAVSLVAIWFGTSVAAREIIRERTIYRRERMFNLGILPYLASKLLVLGFIVTLQSAMLFVPLKFFDLVGLMPMPGELFGIPQFWAMLLTAGVGVSIGLFVSSLVRTPEMATSLVPLILIPQILFSGLVGLPNRIDRVIGMTVPAAWSFDTMKRFSTLDTLEAEGSIPRGKTNGLGLYKYIESENDKAIEKAKKDVDELKKLSGGLGENGTPLKIPEDSLEVPEIKKLPRDLSNYITFLHPWMNEVLNQLVLMVMFLGMVLATLIVQRVKDFF